MANVRVLVRVRPLSQKEKSGQETVIVNVNHENKTVAVNNVKVPENAEFDSREKVRLFAFQDCFDWDTPQETIFDTVGVEVLDVALRGFNACVLAYGQSGTGKTFTMMGDEESPGLTPRICRAVFPRLAETSSSHELRIAVSFLEIHNERVRDLLKTKSSAPLKVREHPQKGTYVEGLSEVGVSDACTLTGLLAEGNSRRCTARLGDHSRSSRSHAVFTLALAAPGQPHALSKVHLVDLAGSERAANGGSRQRKEEGANINKSLVTLGNVISTLAEKSRNSKRRYNVYIPYRDSVLTWLLRDSLGGNAHTFMIATVSPANGSYSETVNTLRYAQRAKRIVNKPRMNAKTDEHSSKTIQELRAEVAQLKTALAKLQMNGVVKPIGHVFPCAADRAGAAAKRWISHYTRHVAAAGLQHTCPQSYSTTLQFFMGQSSSSGCEATPPPPAAEEALEVREAPCTLLPVMLLDHVAAPMDLRLSSSCDLVYRSLARKINRSQHRDYCSQDSIPPDPGLTSPENSLASSSSSLESNRSLDGRMGSLIGAANIYRNKRSGIPVRVRSASSPDLTGKSKKRTKQDIVADVTKRLYPVKKTRDPAMAVSMEAETCSRAANRLRELSKKLMEVHRKPVGKVEVETQTEKERITREAAVGTENRLHAAVLASDILIPAVCLLHNCVAPEASSGVQPDLLDQCRSCEKLSDECFSDDSLENALHQSVETDSLDDALDDQPRRRRSNVVLHTETGAQGGWEIKLEVSSDEGGLVKVTHSSDDSRPVSSDDNNSCPSPLSSEGAGSFGSDSSGDDILYFMQSPQPPKEESPPTRFERSLYTILESSEHSDQSDGASCSPRGCKSRSRSASPKSNITIQIDENKNVNARRSKSPTCSITFQDGNCNHVEPVKEVLFEGEFTIRPKFSILTQNSKPTVCYPNDSARLISNSFYPEFTKGLEDMIHTKSSTASYTSACNSFTTETTTSYLEPRASPGPVPDIARSADKNMNFEPARSPSPFARRENFSPDSVSPSRSQEIGPRPGDLTDTVFGSHSDKSHANQYSNEEAVHEIKKVPDARDLSADSLKSRENMAQLPGTKEWSKLKDRSPPVSTEQASSIPWADPVQRKFLNINVTTPSKGAHILRRDSSDDSITFVYLGPNRKNAHPVLLELVQRSSKGLQRSISLDSATRALGKFSKQSSAKNNYNRAYSVENVNPEETRSFLEPMPDPQGPNHNFKRLRREALTPSDSEVRSTDDDFEDSPPPELPRITGSEINQNWNEMKSMILGHQYRQPSSSPSPPPVPPKRRSPGKKAVSWSDISGCGLISSPSTHSLPSPVTNSPKPIIKKSTLPPVPQSRSPSPGPSMNRERLRLDLQNLHRPLRERSVSAPRLSRPGSWGSPGEDSSPSPTFERARRDVFSRSPPRCSSPRCRSVGDVTQVGTEQEPIRQFLAQATDLLHSLSDLSRQLEQQIPATGSRFVPVEPLEEVPELSSSFPNPTCHHCRQFVPPTPAPRLSYYEPSPLERQLEASCARLEASLRSQPRWQELCEEEPQRPPRRSSRPRWQQPQQLPPLPYQHRPQFSPRAYMRYLLGVRKRIIQSAREEDDRRPPDEDYS